MAEVILISSDVLGFSIPMEAVEFSTFIEENLANKNPPPGNQVVVVEKTKTSALRNIIAFLGHQMVADGSAAELYTVVKEKPAKHKGNTLRNIVYFLSLQTNPDEAKKKKLNAAFLNCPFVTLAELFETALAAHDLGIKVLEDLMCERIAVKVKNVPVEDVRKDFETYTDLKLEQVAFTKTRYRWAFEGGDRNAPPAPPPSE